MTSQTINLDQLHATMGHYARMMSDMQKTRIAMNNRVEAMKRDGLPSEWCAVPQESVDELDDKEKALKNQLSRLARRHFMRDWIESQPGIGLPGFAQLLGITGSLDNFANVAKLWHYLGLHVVEGEAPRKRKGEKLSYSPQGRTLCYLFGEAIVKVGKGEYRTAYDNKKAYYQAQRPDWTPLHCHRAAMRYAVKELIKNLWVEWHRRPH